MRLRGRRKTATRLLAAGAPQERPRAQVPAAVARARARRCGGCKARCELPSSQVQARCAAFGANEPHAACTRTLGCGRREWLVRAACSKCTRRDASATSATRALHCVHLRAFRGKVSAPAGRWNARDTVGGASKAAHGSRTHLAPRATRRRNRSGHCTVWACGRGACVRTASYGARNGRAVDAPRQRWGVTPPCTGGTFPDSPSRR